MGYRVESSHRYVVADLNASRAAGPVHGSMLALPTIGICILFCWLVDHVNDQAMMVVMAGVMVVVLEVVMVVVSATVVPLAVVALVYFVARLVRLLAMLVVKSQLMLVFHFRRPRSCLISISRCIHCFLHL